MELELATKKKVNRPSTQEMVERRNKALEMYREGFKFKVIYAVYGGIYAYITDADREKRNRKLKLYTKSSKSSKREGHPISYIPFKDILNTYVKKNKIISNIKRIAIGDTVTLQTQKKKTKKGKCIYRDDKLFVIQCGHYKESFSINDFIGQWKIVNIVGGACDDDVVDSY